MDSTTNRGEFNRAYKAYLDKAGKIRCGFCPYHGNENSTKKYYYVDEDSARYPNWKLVSKKRKQWEKKPTKKEIEKYIQYDESFEEYVEITW